MKQYSRIVADSICESRILSGIRGYFCESRIADNKPAEQTGPVGRTDLGVSQQRSECKDLVPGKRDLRTDLLQMAEEIVRDGQGAAGSSVC